MEDASKNLPNRFLEKGHMDYHKVKILKAAQYNLENANHCFSELAKDSRVSCVSPEKIYIQTLKEGNEKELKTQAKVKIHMELVTPAFEALIDTWANKEPLDLDLSDAIPGFAWGMKGMKVGEIREIYIHPSVGYGLYTPLEKGIFLMAKVELISILDEEGSPEFTTLPTHRFDDVLSDLDKINYQEISNIMGYKRGYAIWSHYKLEKSYSLTKVIKSMKEIDANPDLINYESPENQDLLNRLHWILYRESEKNHSGKAL